MRKRRSGPVAARLLSRRGQRVAALLVGATLKHLLAAAKLHADDTPVPVVAPSNGTTKTGHLWTHVRDDRPAGVLSPPAIWFTYSPDRKFIHPQTHLANFKGVLQAVAYAGFNAL